MNTYIDLFGSLVLTFLGFVVPLIGLILSYYQEGTMQLNTQYQREKTNAEENIKSQLKKIAESSGEDIEENEIRKNLDKLKKVKKEAEKKLSLLDPQKQIIKQFTIFGISFLMIELSLFMAKFNIRILLGIQSFYIIFLASIAVFIGGLINLWSLSIILINIKKTSDEIRGNKESDFRKTVIKLFETVNSQNPYLKDVFISINGNELKEESNKLEVEYKTQEKNEINIGVSNNEKKMAKNIEVGFILPKDFIVEDHKGYSIYNDGTNQIIRNDVDSIHGSTRLILAPLNITPLSKGTIKIKTFIKAENIEVKYSTFFLKIV